MIWGSLLVRQSVHNRNCWVYERSVCTDYISRKCFVPDNNDAELGKIPDLSERNGFASVSDMLVMQTCAVVVFPLKDS